MMLSPHGSVLRATSGTIAPALTLSRQQSTSSAEIRLHQNGRGTAGNHGKRAHSTSQPRLRLPRPAARIDLKSPQHHKREGPAPLPRVGRRGSRRQGAMPPCHEQVPRPVERETEPSEQSVTAGGPPTAVAVNVGVGHRVGAA